VVLSPPVGPGIWVSDEGCCSDPTHHRRGLFVVDGKVSVSQRFAIDWMRLDQRHREWVGAPPPLGPLPTAFAAERCRARPVATLGGPAHAKEAVPGTAALVPGSRDPDLRDQLGSVLDAAGLFCAEQSPNR